jgi:uncharacterized membrane protein YgcG
LDADIVIFYFFVQNLLVKGCAAKEPNNVVVKGIEAKCRQIGSSYEEGSLKYCNCHKCNEKVITCETSDSGNESGDGGGGNGETGEGGGGSRPEETDGGGGNEDRGNNATGGSAFTHFGLLILGVVTSMLVCLHPLTYVE